MKSRLPPSASRRIQGGNFDSRRSRSPPSSGEQAPLIKVLSHPDAVRIGSVAEAMFGKKAKAALPKLKALLQHRDALIQLTAKTALASIS